MGSSNHSKMKIMGGLATLMIIIVLLFDLVTKAQVIAWLITPSMIQVVIAGIIFILSWAFIITLAKATKWRLWLSGIYCALILGWLLKTNGLIQTVLTNTYPILTGVILGLLVGTTASFLVAWLIPKPKSPTSFPRSLPPLHTSRVGTSLPPLKGSTQLPPLQHRSSGKKSLILVVITIVLVCVFVITLPKTTTIQQVEAVVATEAASSSGCDPSVVFFPYTPEDEYFSTQGLHGQSYGHLAIDVASGNGTILYSPLCNATVIYNGYDQWGNTKLELRNQFFVVMLLHGLYSLPVGTTVDHNTQIGTESNIGYTIDMDGNSCKGRDCGYHSHLNITDLAGNNLNPLEYFKDRPVSGVVAQAPQVNIVQDQGGGTSIAPLFTKEVQHWAPQIVNWSAQHGLDPNLVATVMQIESCGDPQAHSPADARGLFQIVPKWHPASCDYFDPECNAALGMKYLQVLMANYPNDPGRVFAAYNGGITGTKGSYDTWPAEAQRYYRWGTGIYKDAQSGSTTSETLNQWLAAGGASLCQQAAARLGLNP